MTTAPEEKDHWDKGAATYKSDDFTQEIVAYLQSVLRPGRTLEIGVGQGRIASRLAGKAYRYTGFSLYGIDISSKMLDLARHDNVNYRTNDGRHIPMEDDFFDNIYSVNVFQHIPDTAKIGYIKEAWRTLKSGGIFCVQFIVGNFKGDFDHNATSDDMAFWLEDAGFEIENIEPGLIHPHWSWITAVKP